ERHPSWGGGNGPCAARSCSSFPAHALSRPAGAARPARRDQTLRRPARRPSAVYLCAAGHRFPSGLRLCPAAAPLAGKSQRQPLVAVSTGCHRSRAGPSAPARSLGRLATDTGRLFVVVEPCVLV